MKKFVDFDLEEEGLINEPETAYAVNKELNIAWQLVEETGANLFLTGKAGTGKTTFLRKLKETSAKRMVVLAPTGVAAINARGATLHSFFQLPFAPYLPGSGFATQERRYFKMGKAKKRLINSLSLLVIDEISMVRPDTLDAIDEILRKVRNSNLPFGGVQLLLIGDLRQLPPVVKGPEWELLAPHYATPYFFESHALQKAGFQTVELSVVYRQSDAGFLSILNSIRDGRADMGVLAELNRRHLPGFEPADDEGYIRLTTHNRNASQINESRLNALPGHLYEFEAEIEGDFPESAYPAERNLRLKEGAQVMFVKNDTGASRRYYNGLIGTVESVNEEKLIVRPLEGGDLIEVEQVEWENTRYAVDTENKTIAQETIGVFRQYPLQLAWAITIHKSQGLTFEKAIIDATHSFAPGQSYVALSRCRSLNGLVLERPVPPSAVIIDRTVNGFTDYCERNMPDEATVEELKNKYFFTLLSELFDFETLRRNYDDFYRVASEYLVPLHPELEAILREFKFKIEKELCEVSRKFLNSYNGRLDYNLLEDTASPLKKRIKNGCDYFLDTVVELGTFLNSLPRDMDNQTYAERLNNVFDSLIYTAGVKAELLNYHRKVDFSVNNYIDAKARAVISRDKNLTDNSSTFSGKKNLKPKKEKKPKGYSTFETLKRFNEGKSIPEIANERGLAEGTIVGHIVDLIKLGKIDRHNLADDETVAFVKGVRKENPELTVYGIVEKVNSTLGDTKLPSHIVKLCLKL